MENERSFTVTGMKCDGCERKLIDALGTVEGVRDVSASSAEGRVRVVGGADDEVRAAIEREGFSIAR
jgi:copper chaperone